VPLSNDPRAWLRDCLHRTYRHSADALPDLQISRLLLRLSRASQRSPIDGSMATMPCAGRCWTPMKQG
jgi:hypothetical protein